LWISGRLELPIIRLERLLDDFLGSEKSISRLDKIIGRYTSA